MSRIRVSIVGGGKVGTSWIQDLGRWGDVEVRSIVTRSSQRQKELSQKHGILAFGSVPEMLEKDKPDLVCVVNANEQHAPDAIKALEADCHVYLEKPMAPTLQECEAIVTAEKKSKGHMQVGFEYIHGTMTGRLKDLIGQGYFGDVLWLSVLDSRGHWWSDAPDAPIENIWKLDRARGGGIVFHCGIHQLDLIRHYMGEIEEISAFSPPENPLSFYPDDVPANVTLMIKARSGARCNFQIFHDRAVTYYREKNYKPHYWSSPGHEFNISVVGSQASGYMRIYDEVLHLMRLDARARENRFDRTEVFGPNQPDKTHHDMIGLVRKFLDNISSGKGAVDPSAEALSTMRLAFAAEDAIAGNKTVYLKDYGA